ncbi:preprotein translocase subunit SecG [Helicobacter fennelliae]|uniref:Protein-export membrane protein SecG n=2 Tax=Helicobacter fennelliae TaxID=215 RepID=T1CR02_9HELI|nr:preprotein translocase subunit SecG [Helicobacter fennelliae]GAD19179.1 preprotein translocase subunit SecG [Helicobacter fennelliae MRY12-0050]SQB98971.1 preprotein translocase subunit SecG [Helicobacter fennelliae]STP08253.1 preprotein translocase subunit SecG [Helicobacter fennelliae]STQ84663.1 preprotein translocase subunit SecG [Helicobacter fennelliae]
MNTLFVVIEIILAIMIVGVVLLQKSSNMGLGVYSGSNESLFGAKGPAGFLAKATMILGFLFLVNTIFLGYQFNSQQQKSVFDNQTLNESNMLNQSLNPQTPLNTTLKPMQNQNTLQNTQNTTQQNTAPIAKDKK